MCGLDTLGMRCVRSYINFLAPSNGATRSICPPPLSLRLSHHSMDVMHIKCRGCHKVFTRSGYTLHVTKTQRLRCRTVSAASLTFSRMVPSNMDPVVLEDSISKGGRNLTMEQPNHNFTATRVVNNNGKTATANAHFLANH